MTNLVTFVTMSHHCPDWARCGSGRCRWWWRCVRTWRAWPPPIIINHYHHHHYNHHHYHHHYHYHHHLATTQAVWWLKAISGAGASSSSGSRGLDSPSRPSETNINATHLFLPWHRFFTSFLVPPPKLSSKTTRPIELAENIFFHF